MHHGGGSGRLGAADVSGRSRPGVVYLEGYGSVVFMDGIDESRQTRDEVVRVGADLVQPHPSTGCDVRVFDDE